jgi:hypothetical protein
MADQEVQQQEEELTPQEELERIVRERVTSLAASGNPDKATALLVEFRRTLLSDDHPSKNPNLKGVIEGEKAGQLVEFEREARDIELAAKFIAAFSMGGINAENLQQNAFLLGNFIRDEHPNLLAEAANYLVLEKTKQGLKHQTEAEIDRDYAEAKARLAKENR